MFSAKPKNPNADGGHKARRLKEGPTSAHDAPSGADADAHQDQEQDREGAESQGEDKKEEQDEIPDVETVRSTERTGDADDCDEGHASDACDLAASSDKVCMVSVRALACSCLCFVPAYRTPSS